MKKTLIASVASLLIGIASANAQSVLAYWNFNSLTPIAVAGAVGVVIPTSLSSDLGTASLNLSGFGGSVDDFAGSLINVQGADVAGASLSLIGGGTGAPFPGNGGFITLSFSTTGFSGLQLSFATRGTASGFDTGAWSWSTDNSVFTPVGLNTATRSTTYALATVDLSGVTALNNAAIVYVRYTLTGATSTTGNNRIDNLTVTAIPEPSTYALAAGALILGAVIVRRRR